MLLAPTSPGLRTGYAIQLGSVARSTDKILEIVYFFCLILHMQAEQYTLCIMASRATLQTAATPDGT